MVETNKTYRVRTDVNADINEGYILLDANLVQDYDAFDILSVKINSSETYKLHNSNYGVVVGRVIANNGFGVPNAKLSIFIESDSYDGERVRELYPFVSTHTKNSEGFRYNLLPDEKVKDCHQIVGTFPNKRYLLDNDIVIEVFDKYYKFTTRTNNAGDYLIMGVPVGSHTIHMDLDISDCGILSQKPRDFVYKGYTIEQFENPNMFKSGSDIETLSQVFSQDQTINVQPFWGDINSGGQIGITRADINIKFTFQPTCVFIGCVASDNASQGITKKCMATENMGNMEEMTTGEGTIEMIRKTPSGDIEEFQIKGSQLINANGVWCYQIPMNLDYMMTDEYGNMVPTDDPTRGIPTRSSVRFRVSMQDNEENVDNFFRAKVLVPHNPQNLSGGTHESYDYEFGSKTKDESFRDLFWNNVYTVKSYIPRIQKRRIRAWKENKFTGIKNCNFFGNNNPIPYNNIRIKLPLMFTILCAIIKCFIFLTGIFNTLISSLGNFLAKLGTARLFGKYLFPRAFNTALELKLNALSEGLCPDLENWYFAPMLKNNLRTRSKGGLKYDILSQTIKHLQRDDAFDDKTSIEYENKESEDDVMCLTISVDYLISCIEMNLAMEHRVINFDFYNDWINGFIYIPRFMKFTRPKKTFLGITLVKSKVRGCMDDTSIFAKTRRYTQQCALGYSHNLVGNSVVYSNVENPLAKGKNKKNVKRSNNLHKSKGLTQKTIFGRNGGICHEHITSKKQNVYYMKPCEWFDGEFNKIKTTLFATDIVLLGSLNDCDQNGLPQAFKYLTSSSYVMPTNLALTNMETNGPLYANSKGTICSGIGGQLPTYDFDSENQGVNIVSVNEGLSGEINYYRNAKDSNIDVAYEGNELSDIIALTEAAGISWDYTGPGQGEQNPMELYYPGGHFLGMTCTNSQTNLKSCINLERICEVGANISQRKEDVSKDENGNITYVYTAPTGFISGDDIMGEDFRSMFSTMNQNRLIATKINPNTGYKMYDFKYSHPINFDGAFKNVIKGDSPYNASIDTPKEDLTTFRNVGIDVDVNNRPDYDVNETGNTQTRTIEDTSLDYYLFRFGLKREELGKNSEMQIRKFLVSDNNKYYLPQYENSYYFYFGMKDGASAIDEFNKEFFSVCENQVIGMGEPSFEIELGENNICEGTQNVSLFIQNMEIPYNKITYIKEGDQREVDILTKDNENNSIIKDIKLSYGIYNFTVVDAEGTTLTKTINIGNDIISSEVEVHDFNVSKLNKQNNTLDIFYGGYFTFKNLNVNPGYNMIEKVRVVVSDETGTEIVYSEVMDVNNIKSEISVPVSKSNVLYRVYLSYQCYDNDNWVDIYMNSYQLKDGSSVSLNMGWKNISYYLPVKSGDGVLNYGETDWWYNIDKIKEHAAEDWVKKVSTFKNTDSGETFSNNVFALNGNKVIWGNPQSSKSVNPKVYCSEDDADYDNYSLDDEYSYYSTIPSTSGNTNYNAIAVNGTMVSGDYWATLKDDSITMITDKNFVLGTGYVFKPLPNGDLQYHVYNGFLTYDKYITADGNPLEDLNLIKTVEDERNFEENGGTIIKNGVFYPSFIYPVIKAPFKVSVDFYIWDRKFIAYDDENQEESIERDTFGGRTELTITNGITYRVDDDFRFNEIYASNISKKILEGFNDFIYSNEIESDISVIDRGDRNVGVVGMHPTVVVESGEDYEVTEEVKAYDKIESGDTTVWVATGVSGITEMSFNIVEGTPDSVKSTTENGLNTGGEISSEVLETLVTNVSNDISYDYIFSNKITYKKNTDGGYVFYRGSRRTPYDFSKNDGNSTELVICKNSGYDTYDSNGNIVNHKFIVYQPGKYQYHKLNHGGGKRPYYFILAAYNENVSEGGYTINGVPVAIDNQIGQSVTLIIDFVKPGRYYWKIPYRYFNENDENDINNGKIIYQEGAYNIDESKRHDVVWLVDDLKAKWKNDGIKNIATPLINKTIRVEASNDGKYLDSLFPWSEIIDNNCISKDANGTVLDIKDDEIDSLYAVEIYKDSTNPNANIRGYKIYPNIELSNLE